MNRRRFLRASALSLAAVPLSRLLAACATPGEVATSAPTPATTGTPAPATTGTPAPATTGATPALEPPQLPAAPPPPEAAAATTTAATIAEAAVVAAWCRQAWGGNAAGNNVVPHTIERLTVHHTAALLTDNRKAPARLRSHQAYHQSLGWPDLAYHFAVDAVGNVYEGRATAVRGDTATEYDPTGHFLVVAEGNFDDQPIPDRQLAGVADVLAWAAVAFGAGPETIAGHRDYAATTCPGASFSSLVEDGSLQRMVEQRIAAGGTEVGIVCGEKADAAIAAIVAGEVPQAAAAEGRFFLRHDNSAGTADEELSFGEPGWLPVAGDFWPG